MSLDKPLNIGFLVNPFAGAGGPAGLKGSDSEMTRDAILAGHIAARAPDRARQFLAAIEHKTRCRFITPQGPMGSACLASYSELRWEILDVAVEKISSANDTKNAAVALCKAKVDLIVFVGGDGTARDVFSAVGDKIPVLGVPSGVKMHSGVFAITPTAAAKVLDEVIAGRLVSLMECEVRDIDEDAFQTGVVKSRHFGDMWVPGELRYIQSVKHGGVESDELVLADIAADIEERMGETAAGKSIFIFATGSTAHFIQKELGFSGTLLGVDVVCEGQVIAQDADAKTIEHLISDKEHVFIILTAIGGQGHIIGRGNQQLSPKVLRKAGRKGLWIVATKTKLEALNGRPLLVDSNDPELDNEWHGLIPVITGYRDHVLYRLGAPASSDE